MDSDRALRERIDARHRVSVITIFVLAAAVVAGGFNLRDHASPAQPGRDWSAYSPAPDPSLDVAALTKDVQCNPRNAQRVPLSSLDDFDPVAIFVCTDRVRDYADGQWSVETREAATSGIGAYLAAMHGPGKQHGGCFLVKYGDPHVVFIDRAGRQLMPIFRRDSCDVPIGQEAFPTSALQVISTQRVARLHR